MFVLINFLQQIRKTKKLSKLAHAVSGMISIVAVALAYGRVSANYRNYQGMSLLLYIHSQLTIIEHMQKAI
jgi:hypothetical protein